MLQLAESLVARVFGSSRPARIPFVFVTILDSGGSAVPPVYEVTQASTDVRYLEWAYSTAGDVKASLQQLPLLKQHMAKSTAAGAEASEKTAAERVTRGQTR
ncbi:MAG: hypothetical protein RXR52_35835 [Paraburkholderia sp.]|uniref:hypothetical protein n=1 Tax=Paraburkholderia sp. TaxID=1926495 RepID=UPI00397E7B16